MKAKALSSNMPVLLMERVLLIRERSEVSGGFSAVHVIYDCATASNASPIVVSKSCDE